MGAAGEDGVEYTFAAEGTVESDCGVFVRGVVGALLGAVVGVVLMG